MRVCAQKGLPARGADLVASPYTAVIGDLADPSIATAAAEGASAIIHTATLHKPHVATHSRQTFVDTNITGTLNLLEAAKEAGIPFVFCSTTSAFGAALSPENGAPAAWITEEVRSVPKNIYGVTKTAAEDLCHLFARRFDVPVVILRLSRFFPEPDDDPQKRQSYPDHVSKLSEFAFRRIGLEDAVSACLKSVEAAPRFGFGRYIISAATPFRREDTSALRDDAPGVLANRLPKVAELMRDNGWPFFQTIDRVYDSQAAQRDLGWMPKQSIAYQLERLLQGQSVLGDLADTVGRKGYHGDRFEDGLYPVA